MKEIDKIVKRIKKRNNDHLREEVIALDNKKKSKVFGLVMSLLTIYALFVSFAIYARHDESASTFNSIFHTNINFASFNETLSKWINLREIKPSNDESIVVSGEVNYIHMDKDYYYNDSHLVIAEGDGVITYVNGKDEDYTVILELDKGVRVTFSELKDVNVFSNDRVYSDDIIGEFNEKVRIIFIKDGKKLSYEEYLELN